MSIILELSFIIFFLFIQFYSTRFSCFLVCWMIYSRNLDTLPYYLVRLVWFRVYFTRLSLVLLRQGECVFLTLPAGGASPPSRVVVWHLSVGPLHFIRASWGVPVPCEVFGDYTVVVASLPRGTGETPSLPVAVAWYRPGGVLECRSASPGRNSGLSVCSAMLCVGTIFLRCLSGEEQLLSKKLSVFLSCSFSGSNNTIELNLSRSLSPSLAVYDYAIVTVETLFAILYLYLFLLELKFWETAILISILICIYAHTNTLSLVITVNIFPPYLYRTKEIMTPIYFIHVFLNISLLLYKKPM